MIEFDYVIKDANIESLVFANALLNARDVRIALVDRHGSPGGYWHQLADFSRVFQPLSSFGLSSHSIKDWRPDLSDAHRDTVLAYCAHTLTHHILPSGRVSYYPKCFYRDGKIVSLETGQTQQVEITRRIISTTPLRHTVRKAHIPCFSCSGPVALLKPRELSSHRPFLNRQYETYCILGGGRMATDAAFYLLRNNIPPAQIRWVKSRETWALSTPQPGSSPVLLKAKAVLIVQGLRRMSLAQTSQALCLDLERLGLLRRISSDVEPQGFSEQLITKTEAAKLNSITGVIRKGHVHSISEIGMLLDEGVVPMPFRTLYIDCTGSTPTKSKPPEIFQRGNIQISDVHVGQPSFSAALIAAVELLDLPDHESNALCAPVHGSDIPTLFLTRILNNHAWFHHGALRDWVATCHLDHFLQNAAQEINENDEIPEDLKAIRAILPRTIINLERLLEQSGVADPLVS